MIPGCSRRIKVLSVGASASGPSSRIEPSSAANMLVVLWTIQSRMGWSSALDATTWPNSERKPSTAFRRSSLGCVAGLGTEVMDAS